MLRDLSYTLRSLRHQPAFTLTAVATLALAIGATIAIFSTVNAVLLRPLPFPRAEDLFVLGTAATDGRVTTGKVAPMEIARLRDPAMTSIGNIGFTTANSWDNNLVGSDGNPVRLEMYGASEEFFSVFGNPMAAGRAFTHEDSVGQGPPLAILSYHLWQQQFGSDPAVLGKPLVLVEGPLMIVGVASRELDTLQHGDMWVNLRVDMSATNHSFDA